LINGCQDVCQRQPQALRSACCCCWCTTAAAAATAAAATAATTTAPSVLGGRFLFGLLRSPPRRRLQRVDVRPSLKRRAVAYLRQHYANVPYVVISKYQSWPCASAWHNCMWVCGVGVVNDGTVRQSQPRMGAVFTTHTRPHAHLARQVGGRTTGAVKENSRRKNGSRFGRCEAAATAAVVLLLEGADTAGVCDTI
jgi:hypothetical protein